MIEVRKIPRVCVRVHRIDAFICIIMYYCFNVFPQYQNCPSTIAMQQMRAVIYWKSIPRPLSTIITYIRPTTVSQPSFFSRAFFSSISTASSIFLYDHDV
jgi:hypothetical protein